MKVSLELPQRAQPSSLSTTEQSEAGFSEWVAVYSSTVSHCRYNVEQLQMDVMFLYRGGPGPVYRYSHVEESVYSQLLLAPSPGRYMHRHVKPIYKATRIA